MLELAMALLIPAGNLNLGAPAVFGPVAALTLTQQRPDTSKARPLERWPNQQDIARLQSAKGQPQWMVLLILGHPSAIQQRPDGSEVWDYPWVAACYVRFENGVCTGWFYTAGY
jgi:hypothetical protein